MNILENPYLLDYISRICRAGSNPFVLKCSSQLSGALALSLIREFHLSRQGCSDLSTPQGEPKVGGK